jgi:hypothetical protein
MEERKYDYNWSKEGIFQSIRIKKNQSLVLWR